MALSVAFTRLRWRFLRRRYGLDSIAVIAGAFLIVAATELTFGMFTPMWERMRPAAELKLHQYGMLLSEPSPYDTVFIGSSLVFMGINPEIIDPIAKIHSFNAGRFAYFAPNLMHAEVTEIIAARPEIRTLVVAFDSWAGQHKLDRKRIDEHLRPLDLRSNSVVYRNRDVFVHWIKRLAAGKFLWPWDAWKDHLYSSGRIAYWGGLRSHANGFLEANGLLGTEWVDYARPLPIGEEQRHLLEDIADRGQRAGVRIIFLRLPEYVRTYDESPQLHREVSAALHSIAEPRGFDVIDYSLPGSFDHTDKSLFFDMHHLNDKGAAVFSPLLGRRLREMGLQDNLAHAAGGF